MGSALFFITSRQAIGSTQPPIPWVPITLSQGVKQPEHEADHTSQFIAKVKNQWNYTFILLWTFIVLYLGIAGILPLLLPDQREICVF
jgi:hypothetical protein